MKTLTPYQQALNAAMWILMMADGTYKEDGVKQTKHKLGDWNNGFCCLGYGAFLTDCNEPSERKYSASFRNKVGLRGFSGTPSYRHHHLKALVILNDMDNRSFQEIGRHLKKHYRAYFTGEVANELQYML